MSCTQSQRVMSQSREKVETNACASPDELGLTWHISSIKNPDEHGLTMVVLRTKPDNLYQILQDRNAFAGDYNVTYSIGVPDDGRKLLKMTLILHPTNDTEGDKWLNRIFTLLGM